MRSILSVFLLVGFSLAATAQSAKIKGSVTTTTNTPLSGATIELSQTTLGTTTDENGNFILSNIPSGNYRLILSYVGFKTKYVDLSVSENTYSASAAGGPDGGLHVSHLQVKAAADRRCHTQ